MRIEKLTKRTTIFTIFEACEGFDLHIQLIEGKHRNYVIDTGLGSKSLEPILTYLKDSEKELIVINTHHHYDHIWGNLCFKNHTIIGHRKILEAIDNDWQRATTLFIEWKQGEIEKVYPNLVFDDCVSFVDDGIEIFYAPGHAGCDIAIYDAVDQTLNVGDNIGDTPENLVPDLTCDVDTYKASLARYETYKVRHVISGHNCIMDASVFQKIRQALSNE
ncbi:hypothetical protein A4S06_10495 [Erysipelotrichaceae bacterium MTC7]|nr:hypothetical protein A4S06_10495 [Erysipelotrichaceae bacterium MTC7]